MYQYNSTSTPIILHAYGRAMEKLIKQLKDIAEKDLRTSYAKEIIQIMRVWQYGVKKETSSEGEQKLWEDLFTMAGHSLDIDAPYPAPDATKQRSKPTLPITYHQQQKGKSAIECNYGEHMHTLIQVIATEQDEEKKEQKLQELINNLFHTQKKQVPKRQILFHIQKLSAGKLDEKLIQKIENKITSAQKKKAASHTSLS